MTCVPVHWIGDVDGRVVGAVPRLSMQHSNSGRRWALSPESVGVPCTSPATNGHAASASRPFPQSRLSRLHTSLVPTGSMSRAAAFLRVSARSEEAAERCSAANRVSMPKCRKKSAAKADRTPLLYRGDRDLLGNDAPVPVERVPDGVVASVVTNALPLAPGVPNLHAVWKGVAETLTRNMAKRRQVIPWRKDRAETRLCKDRSWYGVNDNERAGESREAFRTFEGLRTV